MADPEITTDLATAPGSPGIEARWTSSAKEGVGTALSPASRVWFTVSHGILNEVYYPRVDQACIRDLGLIVTADDGFFSEEKRDTLQSICAMEDGVPAFRTTSRCIRGRYVIEKDIVCDPRRDVVLQRVRFRPSQADGIRYRVYALLAPHLVNSGSRNNAWLGEYKGQPMLFAEGAGTALALASSLPWAARSVGYVGASDGWQDLAQNLRLTQHYQRAPNGNVALTGEIDLSGQGESDQSWVLALGFGRNWSEAAVLARGSLKAGFEAALGEYSAGWLEWQSSLRPLDRPVRKYWGRSGKEEIHNTYRVSCVVLRSHESATFPGGFIASLSIPWGSEKSDADLGGYHL
ncbi:MAG: hypothetical protein ABSF50_20675, partial [Burkholderiaceae bacterium]